VVGWHGACIEERQRAATSGRHAHTEPIMRNVTLSTLGILLAFAVGCEPATGDLSGLDLEVFADAKDEDGCSDTGEWDTGGGVDSDEDGLSNYLEFVEGTDHCDPDSDQDGLLDGDEVLTAGTDPLVGDTDGDGSDDGYEVLTAGTDPLDWDTDDDVLPDGYEVLNLGTDPLDWDTDDDGLFDGYEVLTAGTDPLVGDTDGDGSDDGYEVLTAGTDPLDPNSY